MASMAKTVPMSSAAMTIYNCDRKARRLATSTPIRNPIVPTRNQKILRPARSRPAPRMMLRSPIMPTSSGSDSTSLAGLYKRERFPLDEFADLLLERQGEGGRHAPKRDGCQGIVGGAEHLPHEVCRLRWIDAIKREDQRLKIELEFRGRRSCYRLQGIQQQRQVGE